MSESATMPVRWLAFAIGSLMFSEVSSILLVSIFIVGWSSPGHVVAVHLNGAGEYYVELVLFSLIMLAGIAGLVVLLRRYYAPGILSPIDHGESHKGRRNLRAEPVGENRMKTSWERDVQGNWIQVSNRGTKFPPVAMLVHSVEGPLAGSKFIFYYTPKGEKTGINVIGDFHSKMIPPVQLEKTVPGNFETAFNEDSAAIRKMAAKR